MPHPGRGDLEDGLPTPRRSWGHLLTQRSCVPTIVRFFSHKVVRSGPKLLLQLAVCLVLVVFLTQLLPLCGVDISFEQARARIWYWPVKAEDGEGEEVGGGLRIVVFGSNDAAIPPSGGFFEGKTRSWTELLCVELDCTTYLSFLPSYASPNSGRLSHSLYDFTIDHVHNKTSHAADPHAPGLQFAEPDAFSDTPHLADLAQQIDQFLSLPQAAEPPHETLWVLNVGVWDVWALSGMPLAIGTPVVEAMAKLLMEQVDRLYEAAQDESSIAWSDITAPGSDEGINGTAPLVARDDAAEDRFTVLLPMLLDPSVYPAWNTDRPRPIPAHSKAEELRNAGMLTSKFNSEVTRHLVNWVKAPTSPDQMSKVDIQAHDEDRVRLDDSLFDKTPRGGIPGGPFISPPFGPQGGVKGKGITKVLSGFPWPGKRGDHEHEPVQGDGNPPSAAIARSPPQDGGPAIEEGDAGSPTASSAAPSSKPTPKRPPPTREGYAFDYTEYIMEIMADRQMRDGKISDRDGLGEMPLEESFSRLSPCMSTAALEAAEAAEAAGDRRATATAHDGTTDIKIDITVAGRKTFARGEESSTSTGTGAVLPPPPPTREWAMSQRTDSNRGGALTRGTRELGDAEADYLAQMMRLARGSQELARPVQLWTAPVLRGSVVGAHEEAAAAAVDAAAAAAAAVDGRQKALTLCASPDEHLFFTPFVLSPRAIVGIAELAAEMVSANASLRAG